MKQKKNENKKKQKKNTNKRKKTNQEETLTKITTFPLLKTETWS